MFAEKQTCNHKAIEAEPSPEDTDCKSQCINVKLRDSPFDEATSKGHKQG